MTRYRPGDQIRATIDTRDGQRTTTTLTITRADRLGCGCLRLDCPRPGDGPASPRVHLHTGCASHDSELLDAGALQ